MAMTRTPTRRRIRTSGSRAWIRALLPLAAHPSSIAGHPGTVEHDHSHLGKLSPSRPRGDQWLLRGGRLTTAWQRGRPGCRLAAVTATRRLGEQRERHRLRDRYPADLSHLPPGAPARAD